MICAGFESGCALPSSRNVLRISAYVINSVQLRGLQLQRTLHHHLQAGALRNDDLVAAREQRIDQCTGHAGETADRRSRTRASAGRASDDTARGANDPPLAMLPTSLPLLLACSIVPSCP